jgi:diguanylate cyclase (GGDEF)-like protein
LYVISPARNLVEAVAVWGDSSLVERVFSPGECWALRRGRVHWVEDTGVGLLCKHLHRPPPEGYLCVPMMAQSEALGILHLTQPPNTRLTEAKQRLALAMAEHIAMALSNLKLHETLRSQSIRDPLTGLFNRRYLEETMEREFNRVRRQKIPLAMIMMDLDHFKQYNDTFGHSAGDDLLNALGSLLKSQIRGEDISCRYGGEEFLLILPGASVAIALERAESLRLAVKEMHVRYQELKPTSLSMGVAVYPDHGDTGLQLIQAADAALYRAKKAGRDRIMIAEYPGDTLIVAPPVHQAGIN